MGRKLLNVKYYLKKDGKVSKLTKEEYDKFISQMKKEGKTYQCSNCKVCDCEKIRYTDIYNCEEVELGVFVKKVYQFDGESMVKSTVDNTFTVFECKEFAPFREIVLKEQNAIKDQLLEIEKQILELEDQILQQLDEKKQKELNELMKIRKEKMKLITEKYILDKLKRQQKFMRQQHIEEKVLNFSIKSEQK